MVRLFDVQEEKGRLTCHYSPESSKSVGYVVYDVSSDTIVEEEKSEFDKNSGTYVHFVKLGLRELAKKGPPYPEKYPVMWY